LVDLLVYPTYSSECIDGITTAVLDLNKFELVLCAASGDSFQNLCLPRAVDFTLSLDQVLKSSQNSWNDFGLYRLNESSSLLIHHGGVISKIRPLYHPTSGHHSDSRLLQNIISSRLSEIAKLSNEKYEKSKFDHNALEQQLSRLSFTTHYALDNDFEKDMYFSDSDSDDSEGGASDDNSDGGKDDRGTAPILASNDRGSLFSFSSNYENSKKKEIVKTNTRNRSRRPLIPKSIHRLSYAQIPEDSGKSDFLSRLTKTQVCDQFFNFPPYSLF
jgi:hypothetical protein